MKIYRWEAECEFTNLFMQEFGQKRKILVQATLERDARRKAQLEMCRKLGISTMMHYSVKIKSIKNLDEPKKRSPVFR